MVILLLCFEIDFCCINVLIFDLIFIMLICKFFVLEIGLVCNDFKFEVLIFELCCFIIFRSLIVMINNVNIWNVMWRKKKKIDVIICIFIIFYVKWLYFLENIVEFLLDGY